MALSVRNEAALADLIGEVEWPDYLMYVWKLFLDLQSARQGGFGPQAITYTEIEAFQRVTGRRLSKDEVYLLRVADQAYMEVSQEK